MLGVALAFAVHVINASALDEFAQAVRSVSGQADLTVSNSSGARIPDALYGRLSHHPDVAWASPVLEINSYALAPSAPRSASTAPPQAATPSASADVPHVERKLALRVLGVDALQIAAIAPDLLPLPGAGADMAAWVSYATSKRFSKEPEKFGTGHPEGLVEAGASNNASLASGWVPSLLFGIPGDTITAIAIGDRKLASALPHPNAIGIMPAPIAMVVITIGRARLWQASIRASKRLIPATTGRPSCPSLPRRASIAYSTNRIEFLVAIPISMIKPISDGIEKLF
jgi:hypothetical protein